MAPGGVTTTVLAASSCTAGAVVPYSDRGPASKCEGSFGEACAYACDPGFASFGKHVCGADGAFRGGRCTPAGKVPFLCGGIPEGGATWSWAIKSLSADFNLNVLKDTYDYSCI